MPYGVVGENFAYSRFCKQVKYILVGDYLAEAKMKSRTRSILV